jgi:hypothetical protein
MQISSATKKEIFKISTWAFTKRKAFSILKNPGAERPGFFVPAIFSFLFPQRARVKSKSSVMDQLLMARNREFPLTP